MLVTKIFKNIRGVIQENNKKIYGIIKELKSFKKVVRKDKNCSDLSLRFDDMKDWKKITINEVERLKQTILQTEELNKTIEVKIKKRRKIINLP